MSFIRFDFGDLENAIAQVMDVVLQFDSVPFVNSATSDMLSGSYFDGLANWTIHMLRVERTDNSADSTLPVVGDYGDNIVYGVADFIASARAAAIDSVKSVAWDNMHFGMNSNVFNDIGYVNEYDGLVLSNDLYEQAITVDDMITAVDTKVLAVAQAMGIGTGDPASSPITDLDAPYFSVHCFIDGVAFDCATGP